MRLGFKRIVAMTVIFVMALLTLNGCFLLPKEEEAMVAPVVDVEEISTETVKVTRGDIEITVQKSGEVVSTVLEDLYFSHSGILDAILVTHSQKVSKDEIVAQMDIKDLEYEMQVAEINLKRVKLAYSNNRTTDMKYSLQLAQLAYDRAVRLYDEAVLRSPIDGVVTYIANVKSGDAIGAYNRVVRISDPTELCVQVTGSDADVFTIGMEVDIVVQGGKTYKGKVVQSGKDQPENTAGDSEERTVVEVDLKGEVEMGTKVTIKAITSRSENTLLVPTPCVKNYLGRTYVQILRDGVRTDIDVEIGLSNANMTEILAGLEEGDEVIR